MRFAGSLWLEINKSHAWVAGQPYHTTRAESSPRVCVKLLDACVSTSHWANGGEAAWNEQFLFTLELPGISGSAWIDFRMMLTLENREAHINSYSCQLASLISKTGKHWLQLRSIAEQDFDKIRGELLIEIRWLSKETAVPREWRQVKESVVVKEKEEERDPITIRHVASTPLVAHVRSNHSGIMNKQSQNKAPHPLPSHSQNSKPLTIAVETHKHSQTRPTSNSSELTTATDFLNRLFLTSNAPFIYQARGYFASSLEPRSSFNSHTLISNSPVHSQKMSSLPFVYSGQIVGHLSSNISQFDDMNFLEALASLAHITELLVYETTSSIIGLKFVWTIAGVRIAGNKHCIANLSPSVMTFDANDFITSFGIKKSDFGICSLTVVSTRQNRTFGLVNAAFGELAFDSVAQVPRGSRLVCVQGAISDKGLCCLGIYHQEITTSLAAPPSVDNTAPSSSQVQRAIPSLGMLKNQITSRDVRASH